MHQETPKKTVPRFLSQPAEPGPGTLGLSLQGARVMKTIFVMMVLAFAFTTGMAVTTIIAQTVS